MGKGEWEMNFKYNGRTTQALGVGKHIRGHLVLPFASIFCNISVAYYLVLIAKKTRGTFGPFIKSWKLFFQAS